MTTHRETIIATMNEACAAGRIPVSVARALRSAADPNDVDTALKVLCDHFIAHAKMIDPSIEGAWLAEDLCLEGRDAAPQMISFERKGSPFLVRTTKKPSEVING